MVLAPFTLPPAWTVLDPHRKQHAYYNCQARFVVVEAGRRSGKTLACKRRRVRRAIRCGFPGYRCLLGAPTQDQAEAIWWTDIIALIPPPLLSHVRKAKAEIHLTNGAHFKVAGLDAPQRIEGVPFHDGGIDEIADCREDVWDKTLSPLVDTKGQEGRLDFIGVPRPSALLRRLSEMAQGLDKQLGKSPDWAYFHWTSEELLTPSAIAAARARMDPLHYAQEYLAQRVSFSGRIYHGFTRGDGGNIRDDLPYIPGAPLYLCFDFNTKPGVCALLQEHMLDLGAGPELVHFCLDEVVIPVNSTTDAICRKVIADYGAKHFGPVYGYGDASGGNKGSAKLAGSDWDIIDRMMRTAFPERFQLRVPAANPRIRSRVNSFNARILSMDGKRRFFVHPRCSVVLRDMDEVQVLAGSDGEISKANLELTHISDAIGYFFWQEFPLGSEPIAPISML